MKYCSAICVRTHICVTSEGLTLSAWGLSESDVCKRLLAYKDGPSTERINIFITAVDP